MTSLVACCSLALLLILMNDQLQVYYTPSKLVTLPLSKQMVRLGGTVDEGSVEHNTKEIRVNFNIKDDLVSLPVVFYGVLPALFKEGQAAVVQGVFDGDTFRANEVLAKHDENYQPIIEIRS